VLTAAEIQRFSTDDFPERDRIPIWRDMLSRSVIKAEIVAPSTVPISVDATICRLPNLTISRVTNSPYELKRTPSLVADGDDAVNFSFFRKGGLTAQQKGQDISVQAGEALVWSNGHVGSCTFQGPTSRLSLIVPRKVMERAVPDLDRLVMTVVPRDLAALKLLCSYAWTAVDEVSSMSSELKALSATHVQDLLAVTLGATRDVAEIAKGRGVRVARLNALKADIATNMGRQDLSLETLARRHGISPRYVRSLFDGEGTSFTDHVLGLRLTRAYAMLCNRARAHEKISTIAFECGFGDLSNFNHAFRRHFGLTPSDARALALES